MTKSEFNSLSKEILDASICVHREMGPGLLESVYEQCLLGEFRMRNIFVEAQVLLPLKYKGVELKKNFIVDIVVEKEIFIEIKSVVELLPVHDAQIISYLRLKNKRLGFLINFNVPLVKDGFFRFVNKF